MRRSSAAAIAATLVAGAIGAGHTEPGRSASSTHVISLYGIDGFRLGVDPDTTYKQALRRFGPLQPPFVTLRFRGGVICRLVYAKLGLSLDFGTLGKTASPENCTWFYGATVTGHAWRTAEGLRMGAPLHLLRSRYPAARNAGLAKPFGVPTYSAEWWLTPIVGHGRQPVLMAVVKHGRVIGLELGIVGH